MIPLQMLSHGLRHVVLPACPAVLPSMPVYFLSLRDATLVISRLTFRDVETYITNLLLPRPLLRVVVMVTGY